MNESSSHMKPHAPQAVLVECPQCKQPGFVDAWPRITSTVDVLATQLLMDGKLFEYECPVCGNTVAMAYDCLFFDEERRTFLLYTTDSNADTEGPRFLDDLVREQQLQDEYEALGTSDIECSPSSSSSAQDGQVKRPENPFPIGTYQTRLVGTTFELCEKARILAAGFDDRSIELMKVAIKRGMLEEGIIGARDILIYERTMPDGGVSFVVVGEIPGDVVGVPQGYDYCVKLIEKAEEEGTLSGEYRFNAAWANRFLP
ncbi:MAG: CpXC domain-containing protein [Eggerthellaceae bacterium]|nr:CpXC domain-containing protein [Eggerthellaceae bacterium]